MIAKKDNIVVSTTSIGRVELRHMTVGDSVAISHLLATRDVDNREFVLRTLHRQLVMPKKTITEFRTIDEPDISKIVKTLIRSEPYTFKYFKDTGDLYADIRMALNERQEQHVKKHLSFSTGFQAAMARFATIDIGVASVGKQVLAGHKTQINAVLGSSSALQTAAKAGLLATRSATAIPLPGLVIAMKQLEAFNKQFSSVAQQALGGRSNIVQTALASLPNLAKTIAATKAEMAMPFLAIADQYTSLATSVVEQLKPRIDFFQNWIGRNPRVYDKIRKSWAEIEEEKIREKAAIAVLRKYKWFISPSMPIRAISAILKIAKKRGRKDREINRLFVDHFSSDDWANLKVMVDGWGKNRLFKPRMPILNNCVKVMQAADARRANGAIVVLPTLISQIDGLLTAFLDKHNIPYKTMYDDFVRGGKTKKVGRKSQFKAKAPNALTDDLDELAKDIFLNILFQGSQRGKPLTTPFNFNRHKIMHGEIVRFGRKDYVIRAFMVLDFLAHLK